MGRIGRYTEFANCSVFVSADHANDLPVNMSFAKAALHRTGANNTDPGLAPPRPFNIGSGVVVSEYAVIRDGSVIGDGAVIGAGSVLAGEAEPFGIYGGVPARLLRHRMDPERRELAARVRWWDFDAGYLAANMSRIQDLALQDIEHPRMQERPRIIYRRRDDGGFIPTGFAEDGVERPLSDAPAHIQDYVRHATTDAGPPHLWRSDVWAD